MPPPDRGATRRLPRFSIRPFVALLAFLLFPATAHAQIYWVRLKDPKALKRFAANCVVVDGESVLAGEVKSGVTYDGKTITYSGNDGNNEFYVVNNADPTAVPYDLVDGAHVPNKVKNGVVTLKGKEIDKIQFLVPKKSLVAFAREYALRKAALDAAQKRRDVEKAGTTGFTFAQSRYVTELQQLQAWCDATLYPEAGKKLQAEIDKQKKVVAKEATEKRLADSIASIKLVPTPARLTELGKTLMPGKTIHVQESRHLRVTYVDEITDERVKELMELGEKIVQGFRVDCVDPFLGDDFQDVIPDSPLVEFWFGPDEKNAHQHVLTDWYGVSWGNNQEQRIAALAGSYRRKIAPEYLEYWKLADQKDIEAIVAHDLGHVLSNLHWNADRPDGTLPEFLSEGLGYEFAIEWLGRNSVTCKEFAPEPKYADPKGKGAPERAVLEGVTESYTQLALEHGPTLDALIRKPLSGMSDGDLAKSWSFLEYLLANEGKAGQLFLRRLCEQIAASGPSTQKAREIAEKAFGVTGEDVFKVLEERWKKRADELLKSGGDAKKK
jgi:hypothetical protein